MLTASPDIYSLDFTVLFDLSVSAPTVKFTNKSTGPNLAGCTWVFGLSDPNGLPIHYAAFPVADVTGAWTTFQIPEAIPMPGKNIVWSGPSYTFTITVRDTTNHEFSLSHKGEICRPNGNKSGSNYGEAKLEISTICQDAKIYAENRTKYSYKKSVSPSLVLQNKFTLSYPQNEDGSQPDKWETTDFSNALIPFNVNGPGYVAALESIVQYQVSTAVTVQIKYKVKETFPVQCNYDLCALQCEIDKMSEKVKDGCDSELSRKLIAINGKMQAAIIAKMQPLCSYDVGKLVAEIKKLGGFECDCDCGTGTVPLLNKPGGLTDCNSVVACINTVLNGVDQKCLATNQQWDTLDLLGKFQLLVNTITAPLCGTCTAPVDLTYHVQEQVLAWTDTSQSTVWRVELKRTTDASYALYTAVSAALVAPSQWELDLSGFSFVAGAAYTFRVSGQCANGTYSAPAVSGEFTPNPCFTITNFDAVVS